MNDLVATIAVLLICAPFVVRFIRPFDRDERQLLWWSFLAHQAAALVNILITKVYYGYGDMLSYYRFGLAAADRLRDDFWDIAPRLFSLILHRPEPIPIPIPTLTTSTGSMQGLAAFAMYFLFDSLHAACALIAVAAFVSKALLYRVVREEVPNIPRRPLLVACTMLPSALFWSCSLLKEPIAMIGLLVATYGLHQFIKGRRRFLAATMVVVGCVDVILIKGYIFPAVGLAAAVWHFVRKVRDQRGDIAFTAGHVLIVGIAAVALMAATGALLPRFGADVLSDQLAELQSVGAKIQGGSNYSLGLSAGSPASQAALAPLGLLTALFRPLLFEVNAPIILITSLEMSLFLVGAVLVLVRRGIISSFSEVVRRPFLSFCAMFVLVFGTCVGLATTNMGTLSRYRMPLIPFFAVLLLALMARAPARVAEFSAAQRVRRPSLVPLKDGMQ
jgi:hypothetical protein